MINVGLMGFLVDGDVQGEGRKKGPTGQRRQTRRKAGAPRSHGRSMLQRARLGRYQYRASSSSQLLCPPTLAHTDTQQKPHSHMLKWFEQLTPELSVFSRSELAILFFWCMSCTLQSRWLALTPHIITHCHLSQLINLGGKKMILWNAGWLK